ncbi:hypothetical protein [Mucilaginibacter sp. OK283]|jgi:hypothetical protein|uniref:hypothetical protein n=1 Tax=Mucilaginibacter sp. OK283 TaxID=1881049 RepID=UPI0008D2C0CF|nr:hypothetical protein [Mucilaginibacter sp. OK283]SEP03882.1 hypothetical protein SAMN05428947_10677 [Mucilaginibacter sp. OK283]
MKKITFLCLAIIATGYFSCKKENAAPVSKSITKKELSIAAKKDTTTPRLVVAKDTTTPR